MQVDKVLLRAIWKTLAAIFVLIAVTFGVLILAFPSTMVDITYELGMDDASVWFADRAYDRSGEVYYAAFAAEASIGEDKPSNKQIEKYTAQLVKAKKFEAYCAERDARAIEGVSGGYAQYIYGQLYTAKYRRSKTAEAIDGAFAVNSAAFPKNNAVVAVTFAAMQKKDVETLLSIRARLGALSTGGALTETDAAYLKTLMAGIDERVGELS